MRTTATGLGLTGMALSANAFSSFHTRQIRLPPFSLQATGGWGIGDSRDLVPEEFSKGGERRAFEGYQLQDRGAFMRKVKEDKDMMKKSEMDELMAVAKMAGIDVKDPSERLNKFGDDVFREEDDDDLDVSVQWEEADPFEKKRTVDSSITRMDEDTGAL